MPWRLSLAACAVALGLGTLWAQEEFEPFDVYVDQEEVMARCGPGGEYYRTDPLRHGQRLVVYLETDTGWLGVRPPAGAFSWVPADAIEVDRSGRLGRVIEDGSLSWIGTHLGKARKYMWQVQLTQGESVTILGRAEREGPDGPQLWYRIEPPAGEFRWVHRDQVVDNPELLLRDKPRPGGRVAQAPLTVVDPAALVDVEREATKPSLLETARSILRPGGVDPILGRDTSTPPSANASTNSIDLIGLDAPEAIPLASAPLPATGQRSPAGAVAESLPMASQAVAPVVQPVVAMAPPSPLTPNTEAAIDSFEPIGSGVARAIQPPMVTIATEPTVRAIGTEPSATSSQVRPASGSEWVSSTPRQAPVDGNSSGADYSGWSIDRLQLELSRRMVGAARARDLEGLRLAADRLGEAASSESERQKALELGQRIRQYQSVAARREGEPLPSLGSAPSELPSQPISLAMGPSPPPGQVVLAGRGGADKPESEAAGYLVQVYSARPSSPPFALTDSSGRTTHYVTPLPGFNLRRYLNQHITVAGQTGYDTGLDTPHLIVGSAVRTPDQR